MTVVTRIAPSPTGDMHIGTLRTALYNHAFAMNRGGRMILRIDDTDAERHNEKAVDDIKRIMEWCRIPYSEFYRQSRRQEYYRFWADRLEKTGLARRLENGALALDYVDPRKTVLFTDMVMGDIPVTERDYERYSNQILLRGGYKLNQPTYQFATVVDDYLMDVTHIMRGQDHLPNVARQMFIWDAIQQVDERSEGRRHSTAWPQTAHFGLITVGNKKLSKRDAAASVLQYQTDGILSEALLNFVLKLGWNWKGDGKDIVSMQEMCDQFHDGQFSKKDRVNADFNKLAWFQRKWTHILK